MAKRCDNKSVGVIIRRSDTFAVIKRKNFPVSYAFVAGHCDGDTYEDAAMKETLEEAGIRVSVLEKKLDGIYKNPCKRDGGDGHHWQIFEAIEWDGELRAGSDAKEAFWVSLEELKRLQYRTEEVAKKLGVLVGDFQATERIVNDPDWQEEPGLEPIWVVMLQELGIL